MVEQAPTVVAQQNKKEISELYLRYLQLSSYLFKKQDNPIYNINELPDDSPFINDAKRIASELEVNWKRMTHANSNRIMLALLEDYFQQMQKLNDNYRLNIKTILVYEHTDNT